jgi:hypothetical protein
MILLFSLVVVSTQGIINQENNFDYQNNILNLPNKSNALFNWSNALKSILLKKSFSKIDSDDLHSRNFEMKSSRNKKKLNSEESGLESMINRLTKSIFEAENSPSKNPIIPTLPVSLFSKAPTIKSEKAFCLQVNSEHFESIIYNSEKDDFMIVKGECNTEDLWIPVPIKGNKRIFHLISAKNGMALSENDKNGIELSKRRFTDNQYWVFIQHKNNKFKIFNLKTKNLIAHDERKLLRTIKQNSKENYEKVFMVNQIRCY